MISSRLERQLKSISDVIEKLRLEQAAMFATSSLGLPQQPPQQPWEEKTEYRYLEADEEDSCPVCGAYLMTKKMRERHALWHKNLDDGDLTVRIGPR